MSSSDFEMPSLTDLAYQKLRASIVSGKMQPGYRLVVNDLVEQWKISNTPIKEALNRLVAEGVVEVEPRRGMRVRQRLSAKEVRELYEIRILYETHCCCIAAGAIEHHPQLRQKLEKVLSEIKALLNIGDESRYIAFYEFDEEFHRLLVSLCANDELIRRFAHLHTKLLTFGLFASRSFPMRRQVETYEEHNQIFQAVISRDADAAAKTMRAHLEKSSQDLIAHALSEQNRIDQRRQ